MRVIDIEHLCGKRVRVTCVDGRVHEGMFSTFERWSDLEDDEEEWIGLTDSGMPDILSIDVPEIASIEPV